MARRIPNPWLRFVVWTIILVVPGGMILLGMLAASRLRQARARALLTKQAQLAQSSGSADPAALARWT